MVISVDGFEACQHCLKIVIAGSRSEFKKQYIGKIKLSQEFKKPFKANLTTRNGLGSN